MTITWACSSSRPSGSSVLRCPDDVSLVAPGDVLDYSLPLMPQITTMRINTMLLGRIAANLMFERMKNGHEEVHVLKVKEQLVMTRVVQETPGGKAMTSRERVLRAFEHRSPMRCP